MSTDYTGNSKKVREPGSEPAPKVVEKVIVTEVILPKKGIGRKIRDLFIEVDPKTVMRFVLVEVMLPAAKNMLFDAWSKGGEKMMYGESAYRRRQLGPGPRVTYNDIPRNRTFGGSPLSGTPSRFAPDPRPEPRLSTYNRTEFLLSSREEADLVLEQMGNIIETYEKVAVADLYELVGLPSSHTDNKWGWTSIKTAKVQQVREGWLIEFPPAEPIQ